MLWQNEKDIVKTIASLSGIHDVETMVEKMTSLQQHALALNRALIAGELRTRVEPIGIRYVVERVLSTPACLTTREVMIPLIGFLRNIEPYGLTADERQLTILSLGLALKYLGDDAKTIAEVKFTLEKILRKIESGETPWSVAIQRGIAPWYEALSGRRDNLAVVLLVADALGKLQADEKIRAEMQGLGMPDLLRDVLKKYATDSRVNEKIRTALRQVSKRRKISVSEDSKPFYAHKGDMKHVPLKEPIKGME